MVPMIKWCLNGASLGLLAINLQDWIKDLIFSLKAWPFCLLTTDWLTHLQQSYFKALFCFLWREYLVFNSFFFFFGARFFPLYPSETEFSVIHLSYAAHSCTYKSKCTAAQRKTKIYRLTLNKFKYVITYVYITYCIESPMYMD